MASSAAPTTTPGSSRPVSSHLSLATTLAPNKPSLAQNSSSSSFEDSGANSPGTSNTSQSTPSSPVYGPAKRDDDVPRIESSEISPSSTVTEQPEVRMSAVGMGARGDIPRSMPDAQDEGRSSNASKDESRDARFAGWLRRKFGFNNSLALTTLLVSAVGLLFFGWRTYKLQVVATFHSYVQNCYSRIQSTTLASPQCERVMGLFSDGKLEPPYGLPKRAFEISGRLKRYLKTEAVDDIRKQSDAMIMYSGFVHSRWREWLGFEPLVLESLEPMFSQSVKIGSMTCFLILVGSVFIMRRMRRSSNIDGPFLSAAKTDLRHISITRYFSDAPEQITSGEGYRVLKHDPDNHHYLGQLRQQIRSSQQSGAEGSQSSVNWSSHNNSADTLVTQPSRRGSVPSKVNLRHSVDDDDEEHEGVIELPAKGKTKNFFDPNTGEFIHLAPWKSTEYEEQDPDDEEISKGEIRKAFAQMTTGAVALAGGKRIDGVFLEEMEKWESTAVLQGQGLPPQRAGDCLAGLVTNEYPSGRPQTV